MPDLLSRTESRAVYRTIMDKALASNILAGLSYGFWEFAVESAVHIYNRTPTRVLKWRTPYAVWNNGNNS